jgi:hypothetical protein
MKNILKKEFKRKGVIIHQGESYEQAMKAETNGHKTYKPQDKCEKIKELTDFFAKK